MVTLLLPPGLQLIEVCVCMCASAVLQEWVQQQEAIKNETLEIVYSYWDGSGHRRKVGLQALAAN